MNDHFDHAEWNEVLQETQKMVDLKPSDVEPYSAALVAAQFLDDIATENKYLKLSQNNRVHIDSLLNHVYIRTKQLHNAQVYEKLLVNLKVNNRWLARVLNIYLLDFYNFARKTEETITIANELLHATPENLRFKKIKANALFYQGDEKEAVELYENILLKNSSDYEVLTFLGAYYTTSNLIEINEIDATYLNDTSAIDSVYIHQKQHIIDTHIARTLSLLQAAQKIQPSEHLENQIKQLSDITSQLPTRPEKKKTSKYKTAK
jgi:predicted Zn-dependent protease